jgi:two-component system sensor histidine kinase QseC
MRRSSLARRLLRKLLLPIAATIIIIGAVGYWTARQEIDEVYDSELITAANVLWLVNHYDAVPVRGTFKMKARRVNIKGIDQEALDEYASWRAFRLWKNGKLILASDNARPASQKPSKQGFDNFIQNGQLWRSFALYIPEENAVVEVAEMEAARFELIGNIASGIVWPLLFVLPIIGLLVWRGVHSGLGDLRLFAEAIKKRSPDDMSKLEVQRTPLELLPLARGLNQLLAKLETSLAHERLFMDNAAHELRTPLAALSIQADVALSAKNEAERVDSLQELAGGVTRAAKLVDQMLILGRLKHQLKALASIPLYEVARHAVKMHVPLALHKQIDIALVGDETLCAFTQPELLGTMLGNLLENAIKYTPKGGKVTVEVAALHQQAVLYITDSGPGIPEAEREKVFERFYRISEHAQTGSGLGLAIVKHIADMLQIHITLGTPEAHGGLRVSLYFPAASH